MDKIFTGNSLDVLKTLPDQSVQTCVTSPPYWGLRDYGVVGQLGAESTPEEYVTNIVAIFREVRRVLRNDGTLWLNLGDSYVTSAPNGLQGKNGQRADRRFTAEKLPAKLVSGLKPKDLVGIPWRVAFALQADGWYLRSEIIWAKPNVMPESVRDRPTRAHETIFLLTKSPAYYYDVDAIREPLAESSVNRVKYGWKSEKANQSKNATNSKGINVEKMGNRFANPKGRNKRTVWTVPTSGSKVKHVAMFPEKLIMPCILAGAPKNGIVLDPFLGSGTTAILAKKLGRSYLGIELNPHYVAIAQRRISDIQLPLAA